MWIIIPFWETAHLPLPSANINTYFSLRAKCGLRGGVGKMLRFQHLLVPPVSLAPSPMLIFVDEFGV